MTPGQDVFVLVLLCFFGVVVIATRWVELWVLALAMIPLLLLPLHRDIPTNESS